MRVFLRSEAETVALGEVLGRNLSPGDLILLFGELGAGKTTLVRGIARGVGFRGRVSSPTFALAHVYRGNPLTLHHLDLYRLKDADTEELGLEELLADPRGAMVVEWPQAAGRWPARRVEVRLSHERPGRRAVVTVKRAR
ncbi:MAG: tRNA (adenosine(37)-N6)-threonylcarbamoyltransferase complex ATPase subunit type 1 TsaE [Elusimicrobia bacterium RIFOXYD12_FULL_66_9]|nr:MAG: tRNA (adenosine(37)-N6)-threonylcarbamoyltransferase complex ATPase subunit type 1 TsaE [Elusimicrobia bacterium RIFOXYD12_FULL_66_9]